MSQLRGETLILEQDGNKFFERQHEEPEKKEQEQEEKPFIFQDKDIEILEEIVGKTTELIKETPLKGEI